MIWDSLYLLNKNISRKLIGFQESIRSTLSGKHEYSPRFPKIIWCHVDHLFVIIKAPLLGFSRFLWSWKTWLSVHLYLKLEIPTKLWHELTRHKWIISDISVLRRNCPKVINTSYFDIHYFSFISSFKFPKKSEKWRILSKE